MYYTARQNFGRHEAKCSQGLRLVVCQVFRLLQFCTVSLFYKKLHSSPELNRTAQLEFKTDSEYIWRYLSVAIFTAPSLMFSFSSVTAHDNYVQQCYNICFFFTSQQDHSAR